MIKPHKKNKKVIKLFIICFLIGSLISFIFYKNLNKNDLDLILYNIKENEIFFNMENNSINHIKILSICVLFSLIYIGVPILTGLIVGEGFSIFLKILFINKIYKIKGIIYMILYILLNYGFYIFILFIIFKKLINIFKILYKNKLKSEPINYHNIYLNIIRCIFLIIINFIFDYIIYLYGINILNIFKSVTKI